MPKNGTFCCGRGAGVKREVIFIVVRRHLVLEQMGPPEFVSQKSFQVPNGPGLNSPTKNWSQPKTVSIRNGPRLNRPIRVRPGPQMVHYPPFGPLFISLRRTHWYWDEFYSGPTQSGTISAGTICVMGRFVSWYHLYWDESCGKNSGGPNSGGTKWRVTV